MYVRGGVAVYWGGILFNGYGFYAASFICIQYTNIRRLFYKHDTNKALLSLLDSKNLHPGPKHTKTHTHTELATITTERNGVRAIPSIATLIILASKTLF